MAVVLIVLGALIGAVATGGVQLWIGWRQRLLDRKVAARAILGDLYVSEAMFRLVERRGQWPLLVDMEAPLSTWREFRAAFAAGVTTVEWARVDSVYGELHRIGLGMHPNAPPNVEVIRGILSRLPAAQEIAAKHATDSEGERVRVIEELGRGLESS